MGSSKKFTKAKPRTKAAFCAVSILALTTVGGVATYASYTDAGSSEITGTATYYFGPETEGASSAASMFPTPNMIFAEQAIPGRPVVSEYKVINSSARPIDYEINHSVRTDVENIANLIQVSVKQGSTTVYSGSFSNFSIKGRTLNPGQSETFISTSIFPTSSTEGDFAGSSAYANVTVTGVTR